MNDGRVRDPNASAGRFRRIIWSALFGVAFGALFPLVSTLIALLGAEQSVTTANAIAAHKASPLLQVIDTIPLILGLAAGLLGRAMARFDDFIENLKGTVAQRDMVLQRAQLEATAARKAKGALLGQLVHRMRQEFKQGGETMRDLLGSGLPLEYQRRLKGVDAANRRVAATLWDIEMLASVEDEAAHPSDGELCKPDRVCEETLLAFNERNAQQIRYRLRTAADLPKEICISQERVSRSLTCLIQCALKIGSQQTLDVSLTHFAASHGGASQILISVRNPNTPSSKSVVRAFSDLDPNAKSSKDSGELELALCRQLALAHYGEVGVRPDPSGGMSYWLLFPYHVEGDTPVRDETNTDSQEMVETCIEAA